MPFRLIVQSVLHEDPLTPTPTPTPPPTLYAQEKTYNYSASTCIAKDSRGSSRGKRAKVTGTTHRKNPAGRALQHLQFSPGDLILIPKRSSLWRQRREHPPPTGWGASPHSTPHKDSAGHRIGSSSSRAHFCPGAPSCGGSHLIRRLLTVDLTGFMGTQSSCAQFRLIDTFCIENILRFWTHIRMSVCTHSTLWGFQPTVQFVLYTRSIKVCTSRLLWITGKHQPIDVAVSSENINIRHTWTFHFKAQSVYILSCI